MFKGSDPGNTLEKKALNANLTGLAKAVDKCKKSIGIDSNMIMETIKSEMSKEPVLQELKKLSSMKSVLSTTPELSIRWTVYSRNRAATVRELADARLDLKNFIIIDGA